MARINNLSARLKVNAWLAKTGRSPLDAELSYEQFATELRKVIAKQQAQTAFASRADACKYIRHVASSMAR